MKKILAIALASLALMSYNVGVLAAETQKVCVDKITKDGKPVLDKKTGKPEQECKEMKVHKKLEGTKVPEKADKK
jgi:hypothetical protein